MLKWDDRYFVRCYIYAKGGMSDLRIAQSLGIKLVVFRGWVREKKALREALRLARDKDQWRKAMYAQLSPEVRKIWDKIIRFESSGQQSGLIKIKTMIRNKGKVIQQRIFLHSWVLSAFNAASACAQTGIPYPSFAQWMNGDKDFKALVDELEWRKAEFYEDAMIKLVAQGNPAAVIHVNRSYNRKRGYGDSKEVDHKHSGVIDHAHAVLDLRELGLPLDLQIQIRDAIRSKKALENKSEVIEGNGVVK